MAKKVIKVNTNPNKTPAPGVRNATLHYSELNAMNEAYERQRAKDAGKEYKSPAKKTVKIISGTTRIGNMAGGGLGGMFGVKNR